MNQKDVLNYNDQNEQLISNRKCLCNVSYCAKCLLVSCQDDACETHPLSKKLKFKEDYKNR
jgi:hypothetical protein